MATVRYRREPFDEPVLFFNDQRYELDDDCYVVHVSDLAGCSATDLRNALRRVRDDFGDHSVFVTTVKRELLGQYELPIEPIRFELVDDELAVEIYAISDLYEDDQPAATSLMRGMVGPLVDRSGCSLVHAAPSEDWAGGAPWPWTLRVAPRRRARMLDGLFTLGADLISLLEASTDGSLARTTALDLLRGGHAEVLIGQPESDWLEVKVDHYDLSARTGKIKLALAVSRFANAEAGGLVVVGMATKNLPGGEVVRAVRPLPDDPGMQRRYRSALSQHLYPPPDGLEIEPVPVAGRDGMLMVINVPPQPEELKPFLVHGAIVDGAVEGAFISIVRRRGDASIPTTAPALHSTIAAGRALLRRGHLPDAGD